MSIPSVRFKPPQGRPMARRPTGPIRSPRPTPIISSISFSSSDESSDDLPVIQTHTKNEMQDIGLDSSYSSENLNQKDQNSDSIDDKKNEVNWRSKKTTNTDLISPKSQNVNSSSSIYSDSHYQQQEQQSQLSARSQSSEEHLNSQSDSNQNPHRVRRRVRRVRVPQNQIQQNSNNQLSYNGASEGFDEIEVTRNRTQPVIRQKSSGQLINSTSQPIPQLNNNNYNPHVKTNVTTTTVDISTLPPEAFRRQRSHTLGPTEMLPSAEESHSGELETFTVVKETKRKKNGADFRMMKSENAVYFAKISKDDIGIFYMVSKTIPITSDSPDIVGYLRKQNHGKRYTVYAISEKINDDRDSESLGMAFVKNPDFKSKQKTFRISMRKNGKINYPISKRRELSRIAEDLEAKFPEIDSLFNKPPVIGPDGNPINPFGSMFIVDSPKNYIINDENDQTIFMIFKSSEASYTIKSRFPFNPLMAFGLSIAIIEDCR